MRVLFFGTSPFALPTLQALHDAAPRHEIVGVVTQPDRPHGRGLRESSTPVKELALALGYPIYQPERVRRGPFFEQAVALAPDVLVVISFGQIIPQKLLDLPRFGGVNVHASLLPRWRGAAPIHRAILEGDPETGVATMQMEASLDTGPTYLVERTPIEPGDTVATLEARLAAMGSPLLIETLDRLLAGTVAATPQSDDGMTYASPIVRADGLLDPSTQTPVQMERRVRGMPPRPGAILSVGGRTVRVLETRLTEMIEQPQNAAEPGTIVVQKRGIDVVGANGESLTIVRLQPENKGPMAAADWARGARLMPDERATIVADESK